MKPTGEFYSRLSLEALIALHIKENERKDAQKRFETQMAIKCEIVRRKDELIRILSADRQMKAMMETKTPEEIAHNLMIWTVNAGGVVEE